MKYYKVKSECGGKTAFGFHRGGGLRVVGQYIANELYTTTELKRRGDCIYAIYGSREHSQKQDVFQFWRPF